MERRIRTPPTATAAASLDEFGGSAALLTPYVPRFLLQWVREAPESPYRPLEGSLAFVDISGFTALTEQLARRGSIGSEVMRDTLDGVFRALLDEAYDWGAGLLKWGGDALLLLFDGAAHEARAARAAWEMQRTLERVGRITVGSSAVTLRMSVGIASGRIDCFMAGDVHRELLLAGPTVTETVTIEADTDAGAIGIGASLAAALDADCVAADGAGRFWVAGPPEVERGRAPDVGHVRGADAASCIAVALRRHVLLEAAEPEHRPVTVAFLDMMDTDALLAELGPERFAAALDERVRFAQEAALRYDVPIYASDIGKGSVKLVFTGGAPSTTGRDEEQLLRMLREILDAPGLIPQRAGVNAGRVFAGDFGPPYRRAYAVFGDAINTAARVTARAERGQLLATEIVLERSRALFETTPVEPFKAKGKAKPVRASAVGALAGARATRAAETPLVGRDQELATLRALCQAAAAGTGFAVEVAGARGLGKSRLVAELSSEPGLHALVTRCEEYDAATPYIALRGLLGGALGLAPNAAPRVVERALRAEVGRVDPTLEPWIPLLGILLGLDLPATPTTAGLDERFLRETLAALLVRFLDALFAGTPALLVVEDAQFVDEASADLLRRLAGPGGLARHGLVVTHADVGTTWLPLSDVAVPVTAFTLLPLAERHAVEILALATDEQPLHPHEIEELARRSGGSPLFLFELLDLARSAGTTEGLPDSVEAVAAAEIDRLEPGDRTLLRYASVLGVRVDREVLASAIGVGETELERLRGLLEPDRAGALRFRTTLLRDTAYAGLSFRRRRELHARVAEAIAQRARTAEDEAAALALHFLEAQRYDEAWHYTRAAGDRARTVAAHVDAGRFYAAALAAARHVRGIEQEERARVWVALGAVREAAGHFDESCAALRGATARLHHRPVERARVFALRTRARVRRGAYLLALRETTAGLRAVEGLTTHEAAAARATLLAMRSEVRWLQGHAREAILLAEEAIMEAEPAGELEALARAYTALDGAYQALGHPEKAVHERMSLDIYTRLGDTRSRGIMELNLGVQAYADGRWDEAAALYTSAQEHCTSAGDRQHTAVAGANLGELLISLGRLDDAARVLTDARRVLRSSGFTPFALFAETQLARCALERGETEAAVAALRAIVDEAAGMGHAGIVLEITLYYAQALARAGDGAAGLEALNAAAITAAEDAAFLVAPLERTRAECLASMGRTADALEFLERSVRAAEEQGLVYEQLLARRDLLALESELPREEELRETERLAQLLGLAPA